MTETVFFYGHLVFTWINNKYMLLALLKTNNMPYHVNALFLKIWLGHKRMIHGKALSLKKMKLHLKKSFPFSKCNITSSPKCNITVPWVFWNWKCLKNLYPEKKNVNLFSVNYSNLWKILILLQRSSLTHLRPIFRFCLPWKH